MKDKLLKIINHYGIDKQLKYIHSEYFELDEAIIKYENNEAKEDYGLIKVTSNNSFIMEEIADCLVMLKQFQYYFGITDKEIEDIMNYKIERQLERIEMEKK